MLEPIGCLMRIIITLMSAVVSYILTWGNWYWVLGVAVVAYVVTPFILDRLPLADLFALRHMRGSRLTPAFLARLLAARILSKTGKPGLQWGRIKVPISMGNQHFMIVGQTRSGKTVLARLLMQSVFHAIGDPKAKIPARALVYDGKAELLGVLYGMRQDYQRIYFINPFHKDSARWDIAKDVSGPASAKEIAKILFSPDQQELQKFFSDAVRLIAAGIMQVLNERAPSRWTLGDLVYIMLNADRIKQCLETAEFGRDLLSSIYREGHTLNNIISTIATKLQDYETVAALWDHASTSVSIKEWLHGSFILVIQKHHQAATAVDCINRAIFHRISQLVLDELPNNQPPSTWIVLDEVATAGRLDGLADLMDKGGSKGVCVVLSLQNISGLRKEYQEDLTNKIAALCSTKAFLRLEDKVNAEWASGFFGEHEVSVIGGDHSRTSRATVLPSEFQILTTPQGNPRHDVQGYFVIPIGRHPLFFKDSIPGNWLFDQATLAPVLDVPMKAYAPSEQRLHRTEEDFNSLLYNSNERLLRSLEDAVSKRPREPQSSKTDRLITIEQLRVEEGINDRCNKPGSTLS